MNRRDKLVLLQVPAECGCVPLAFVVAWIPDQEGNAEPDLQSGLPDTTTPFLQSRVARNNSPPR